jgi:predicted RNA methylase
MPGNELLYAGGPTVQLHHLEDYRRMMADPVRMTAYQRAIRATCPGKTVCEIGVGLGPLSLMALQSGAERVYGIEIDKDALEMATAVLKAHGFGPDRFVPVRGISTRVDLPETVDVILSETLDSTGFGENTGTYMEDAKLRFLKPGGVFLPSAVKCYASLSSPRTYLRQLRFWERELADMADVNYGVIRDVLQANSHVLDIEEEDCFSGWKCWREMDFAQPRTFHQIHDLLLDVTRAGDVHGMACAFEATLSPNVVLRNFPWNAPTCWKQGFNPFSQVMRLQAGDSAFVQLNLPQSELIQIDFEMTVTAGPTEVVREFAKTA